MNVLSIHSSVALGHVGNSGAVFALQRLGLEVWPINTVVLSNHPAHGGCRGRVTPAIEIAELVQGLVERSALAACDAVLSGYLGTADQGPAILAAVAAVRAANPRALWLLDPVIGDYVVSDGVASDGVVSDGAASEGTASGGGRVYVKPGIAEFLRDHAAAEADILTPNGFELEFLARRTVESTETALAAIAALRAEAARGPLVVATGLRLRDRPRAELSMLAVDDTGAWRVGVPRLRHPAHGAGDVFAAVLLGRRLIGDDVPSALAHAAATVHAVLARTDPAAADLALIAAQDTVAAPPHRPTVECVR